MTYRARQVLDDCELALEFLEQSPNDQIWRVHWFAAIALVRSVGDVLHKVDGRSEKFRKPVSDAYENWKEDRQANKIFWDFIKSQRDKLIHEYESDVHPLDKASILLEYSLAPIEGGEAKRHGEVYELDDNIYRPMLSGPWEGDDGRDVLRAAIDWWQEELDKIDRAAASK